MTDEGSPPSVRRLFLALWPEAEPRACFAAARAPWREAASPPPKLVPAANLHLTLHFMGDVDAARLPEAVSRLAVDFEPFSLAFGAHALWPNGIAVLTPHRIPRAFTSLHARLAEALAASALPVERRPYRPHVTMARKAFAARVPERRTDIEWSVHDYTLIESRPGRGGYTVLATYP